MTPNDPEDEKKIRLAKFLFAAAAVALIVVIVLEEDFAPLGAIGGMAIGARMLLATVQKKISATDESNTHRLCRLVSFGDFVVGAALATIIASVVARVKGLP